MTEVGLNEVPSVVAPGGVAASAGGDAVPVAVTPVGVSSFLPDLSKVPGPIREQAVEAMAVQVPAGAKFHKDTVMFRKSSLSAREIMDKNEAIKTGKMLELMAEPRDANVASAKVPANAALRPQMSMAEHFDKSAAGIAKRMDFQGDKSGLTSMSGTQLPAFLSNWSQNALRHECKDCVGYM